MNPKVSIIIPVYNAENTVRRTVESLVYGTETNIEIILVEDCSKDNSWNVCQELHTEFKNVHCVRNEKNSGVSFTRNHGIKEASAPYIMFVDSDDWVSVKYISRMMTAAVKFEDCLPVCGFHFWDQTNYSKTDYLWNPKSSQEFFFISDTGLFDAVDKIMMQFCWNKIFKREVLERNRIAFDESQNMGEDFSFVLDYMIAANIKSCVMVNEALYYYIRTSKTSLMSNYGWTSDENAYRRMRMLAELCGADKTEIRKCLDEQILKLKEGNIYHVLRTPNRSKKEKIVRVKQILDSDGNIIGYLKYFHCYYREKVKDAIHRVKILKERVKGRIQREKRAIVIKNERKRLTQSDVSIISQNCIGGVFYHDMKMQFLSPTVNLFMKEPDFIKFVLNIKKYVEMELQIRWEEEFPIGRLGDVEIYFQHYTSCKEAKTVWDRRKERIDYDKILVLATDRNEFTEEVYEQWKKIPYKKILFSANEKFVSENTVFFPQYGADEKVGNLIPDREFYKNGRLVDVINSMK